MSIKTKVDYFTPVKVLLNYCTCRLLTQSDIFYCVKVFAIKKEVCEHTSFFVR